MSEAQQATARNIGREKIEETKKKWDWEPNKMMIYPLLPKSSTKLDSDSNTSILLKSSIDPGWRLTDIILASKLLAKISDQQYSDEAEMRRVFGLVYDVLRCRFDFF